MVAKPIEMGGLSFPKKGAANEHFQNILHGHELGQVIPEPHATHLHWLLDRHPDSHLKIGTGVGHFSVRSALHNTRCFEVVRIDGSSTDFSLKACLDGKSPTALAELLKALRAEVAGEIRQKKWEIFQTSPLLDERVVCSITGTLVTSDQSIIDHKPESFKALAFRFIAEHKIDISQNHVTASKDSQYEPTLSDRQTAHQWREFYRKHATIRIVSKFRPH